MASNETFVGTNGNFVSIPQEVYEDLIRDSHTVDIVKRIIRHEIIDRGYSVIGSDATEIIMAILQIKEAHDDGSNLD